MVQRSVPGDLWQSSPVGLQGSRVAQKFGTPSPARPFTHDSQPGTLHSPTPLTHPFIQLPIPRTNPSTHPSAYSPNLPRARPTCSRTHSGVHELSYLKQPSGSRPSFPEAGHHAIPYELRLCAYKNPAAAKRAGTLEKCSANAVH